MIIPPLTAYDGRLHVHYGQACVLSPQCDMLAPEDAFAGQVNGLCGAAVPGGLFLVTGLHTGVVGLVVQVHAAAPPVDESWEEVVEAPWTVASGPVRLQDWDGGGVCTIPLEPGAWRVRWCARRFGEDPEDDDARAPIEHYALQFWPALHAPDTVLRQRSAKAAYWNGDASWPTMKHAKKR